MKKLFICYLLSAICYLMPASAQTLAQTVYVETPVDSYRATVDDVNYIPESEFMQRADSLNYDQNIDTARQAQAKSTPGIVFAAKPVIICRDYGCTKLNDRITRTFLFNSLANMFIMNSDSRVNICEADPFTRACMQSGITFPVRAGIVSALVKIPRATVNNVSISTGLSKASVGMTYDFLVNGISVGCEPTTADIIVPANTNAILSNHDFACSMTMDGLTNVSLLINLDYIDLDYGILGGYYSFGLQGPTSGGGTGYALFKTEYANKGIKVTAQAANEIAGNSTLRPGEYSVGPVTK